MREGVCRCHRDLWGEWILLAEAWAPLWPRWAKARASKSKSIIAQGGCQGWCAHPVSTPLPGSHPMAHVPWTSVSQPKEPKDDMSFVTSFDSLMPSAPRQSSLLSHSLLYIRSYICLIKGHSLAAEPTTPALTRRVTISACGLPLMPCP